MFTVSQYFVGFSNYILIILINERTQIDIKYAKCVFKLNVKEHDNGSSSSTKKVMKKWVGL